MRYPASPLRPLQDELDRFHEHAPASERPAFPPSPGVSSPQPADTGDEHHAPAADDISSQAAGATVPNTNTKQPQRSRAGAA